MIGNPALAALRPHNARRQNCVARYHLSVSAVNVAERRPLPFSCKLTIILPQAESKNPQTDKVDLNGDTP